MKVRISDGFCEWEYVLANSDGLCIQDIEDAIGEAFPDSPINEGVCISSGNHREANPGVWDNAPEDADDALIAYCHKGRAIKQVSYTRELPKSPAREIAEKWANMPTPEPTRKYLADTIESAINEYAARIGEAK